jgi:hypothetical protein
MDEDVPLDRLGQPRTDGTILSRLGETWPARLVRSAYDAVTLPGDVYAGRVTPQDPRYYDRATDLAGLATGFGGAGAPAGSLRAGFTLDYFGTPVRILESPSPQQSAGFLARTKYKAARRLVDPESGKSYIWDAADPALHKMVAEKLGVKFDPKHADMIGLD